MLRHESVHCQLGGTLSSRKFATAASLALALCGCPAPFTQYWRVSDIQAPPDAQCLLESLRKLADGGAVTYIVGDNPPGTAHRFNYMRSKWHFTLSFSVNISETTIRHTGGVADKNAEQMPELRSSMLETEVKLRNHCGLGDALDWAREGCLGKACSKL